MQITIYNDDKEPNHYAINARDFLNEQRKNNVSYIASSSKHKNILQILESYYSLAKSILFDGTNTQIENNLKNLNIPCYDEEKQEKNIFDEKEFMYLYFTSGTTGAPVGALKTKTNIEAEIEALSEIFKKHNIKRVIVTVPFIHFYGSLLGLMYPLLNDIDIIFKEHFLPHDLLEIIDDNSLVVTTPLYIKSLNMLQEQKDLSKSIFLSSTAPLFPEVCKTFNEKFNTSIVQLFGSTETGGIAYKYDDTPLWTPLANVDLSSNENGELLVKSAFVSQNLYESGFKETNGAIQTFDYVEFEDDGRFKLIGRSSQIIKLAGKRYSTVQIENILEEHMDINKAVATIHINKESLRQEELVITLEAKREFKVKEIKMILKERLSNLKFSIKLKQVEHIKTTSVGKKILF